MIEKRTLVATAACLGAIATMALANGAAAKSFQLKITDSCGTALRKKISASVNRLEVILTNRRPQLERCVDEAYLVEHKGWSAKKIVAQLYKPKKLKVKCRNLPGANANAHKVIIKRGLMNIDRGFVRNNANSHTRVASVIAHELMHNAGLRHKKNDFGSPKYRYTVPEQVEACILTGKPNAYSLPGNQNYIAGNMVGFGLDGENNNVFAWSKDGTVSTGNTNKIHVRRTPDFFFSAPGRGSGDIVGMGVDGENNWVFAWYRDGMVSAGTSRDLDTRRAPYRYSLPPGYSPNDIVGMGVDGENNWIFAWYRNGMVSAGTSNDLDKHRRPYRYSLAPGYSPSDVVGMAVDGENNMNFVWYRDGRVSAGTSDDLDKHRPAQKVGTGR